MGVRDEEYLLDSIEQIRYETHQNNQMLKGICEAVNVYLANHNNENENDFIRNVLANIVSQSMDFSSLIKR